MPHDCTLHTKVSDKAINLVFFWRGGGRRGRFLKFQIVHFTQGKILVAWSQNFWKIEFAVTGAPANWSKIPLRFLLLKSTFLFRHNPAVGPGFSLCPIIALHSGVGLTSWSSAHRLTVYVEFLFYFAQCQKCKDH